MLRRPRSGRLEARTIARYDPFTMIYVYMLRCADGSYYVGPGRPGGTHWGAQCRPLWRLHRHASAGGAGLVARFQRITDAIAAERQIKGWSRAKKEALITGNFNLISVLAKRGGVRRTEIAWQIVGASFETRPCGPLLQHED